MRVKHVLVLVCAIGASTLAISLRPTVDGAVAVGALTSNTGTTSSIIAKNNLPKVATAARAVPAPLVQIAGAPVAAAALATGAGPATTTPVISLVVGSSTYALATSSSASVFAIMTDLSQSSSFRFTGREFGGIGFFVDTIDGISQDGGHYWIFSVNGATSTEGVSKKEVSSGDVIEWKLENSY